MLEIFMKYSVFTPTLNALLRGNHAFACRQTSLNLYISYPDIPFPVHVECCFLARSIRAAVVLIVHSALKRLLTCETPYIYNHRDISSRFIVGKTE
jgi:hypothetical protein